MRGSKELGADVPLMDRMELRAYVRFQLGQLRVLNQAHLFEDLCRAWARENVVSNILPATGPVSAGGDQARDFETFLTYLQGTLKRAAVFAGLNGTDRVVFCCTTQQEDVPAKIAADLKKACGSGTRVDAVFYFTETDLAVAKRHKLIDDAMKDHGIVLEVVDGNALAESLATPELFWIAAQFLDIPIHLALPMPPNEPQWYAEERSAWRSRVAPPSSVGDLLSIASCLNYASSDARDDVDYWISCLEDLIEATSNQASKQRARYEIAVARLRGQGDLRPAEGQVEAFFGGLLSTESPAEGLDASVLVQFLCGAWMMSLTSLTRDRINDLRQQTEDALHQQLASESDAGRRLEILHALIVLFLTTDLSGLEQQALIGSLPSPRELRHLFDDGELEMSGSLPLWKPEAAISGLGSLIGEAGSATLFPIISVAETVSLHSAALADLPEWPNLTGRLDDLVAKATGGYAAGRQSWLRARQLRSADRPLAALRELHRARTRALASGAAEAGTAALLESAECFLELGQFYAAKHQALAAVAVASTVSSAVQMSPRGLYLAVQADFLAGNWFSLIHLLKDALVNHQELIPQINHMDPSSELSDYVGILIQVSHAYPEAFDELARELIGEELRQIGWPPEGVNVGLLAAETGVPGASDVVDQLGQRPFSDVGRRRRIRWISGGVRWDVECANKYPDVLAAERFASVAQAAMAALSDRDLALAETSVHIQIRTLAPSGVSARHRRPVRKSGEVGVRTWTAWLTRDKGPHSLDFEQSHSESLAAFLEILTTCSYLPPERFRAEVEACGESMIEAVMPPIRYDRAYGSLIDESAFAAKVRQSLPGPEDSAFGACLVGAELAPRGTFGPGFTVELGEERARDHYQIYGSMLRLTLQRLNNAPEFQSVVRELRGDGWKDRHILHALGNQIFNFRHAAELERGELIGPEVWEGERDESEAFAQIPVGDVTVDSLRNFMAHSFGATIRGWQLELNDPIYEPDVIEHFLAVRYLYWQIDVPHADPFDHS